MKDSAIEESAACPLHKKNLVSCSQLCRDMEYLLENVMIAEACSAYLYLMMCVIK